MYTWLDPPRTRYGFGYGSPWSPAGLVHALKEDIVFASARGCRLHGGVVVVFIAHLERRPQSSSSAKAEHQ